MTIRKFLLVPIFIFVVTLVSSQEPFKCTGDFYLSQSMGNINGNSDLFSVKIDSNTQEIIFKPFPTTNQHSINAIAYRVTDNFVYGLDPFTKDLYMIDATGTSFLLRRLDELNAEDRYFGADISPSGDVMVMIGGGEFDKNLVIINLTKPDYPTSVIPLKSESTGGIPNSRIVDIAFDPLSGKLYGVDVINFRLVQIAVGKGKILDDIYPKTNVQANIAAMFFDVFGNLYGYGAAGGSNGFGMYRIDKFTGQLAFVTLGPSAGGVDGCSCPFNISMEKKVTPDTTYLCSDIRYVFKIANGSQSIHNNIMLEDQLPHMFEIVSIENDPFNSTSLRGIGTNHLIVEGMTIYPGLDSLVIIVNVGDSPPGTYGNLATLKNLPDALGVSRFSENPATLSIGNKDSTFVTLESPIISFEAVDGICAGDTAILHLNVPEADYQWQDGSTDSFYVVTQPGTYAVTATNGCDTYYESAEVTEQSIDVDFNPSEIVIILGNDRVLEPIVNNTGTQISYFWSGQFSNTLDCIDCSNPTATPLSSTEYNLIVQNEYGCAEESTLRVNVEINRELYIPNIFSPNGDLLNDMFFVQGAGNFNIKYLNIYDRWGNKVFTIKNGIVNDPLDGWDGTMNGRPLDTGVYTWQVLIVYLDQVEKNVSGSITLVR